MKLPSTLAFLGRFFSTDSPTADRFAGCLVGQAVGDAMGFMVEGFPKALCKEYVDSVLVPFDFAGYVRGSYRIGQYTDDTQLARELMQSIVVCGRFDPADYASRIAALFVEGRIVGRGQATQAAALRIANGVPWNQAGEPVGVAGNGSAMRAAPLGLLFGASLDRTQLIEFAHDQGRITHQDPRCSAGAVAIAVATHLASRTAPLEIPLFCRTLANDVRRFDATLSDGLLALPSWIEKPKNSACKWVRTVGVPSSQPDEWDGISPFVTGSVLWSVYSFLKSPDDYWQAICTAIAAGGDADTTAAMTGAIAGARVGVDGIPAVASGLINDQGDWGYDDLVALALDLHKLHDYPGRI